MSLCHCLLVPTDLAIRVACRRLEGDASLPEQTSLSVDDIVGLLSLLEATFLSFRGELYQQVHGTAMGSPVSVVVANLMMEDAEESLVHLSLSFLFLEALCQRHMCCSPLGLD